MELSNYVLFKKLKAHYGEDILIVQNSGKSPIFFYKAKTLFQNIDNWIGNPQCLSNLEKKILIDSVSEIIKHEVADQKYEINEYPPGKSFLETAATDIPRGLKRLLNNLLLVKSGSEPSEGLNVQRDSIAHTIISALKPKQFISKLGLAIGTYVLRKTGSKLIVNLLNKLGVSASYYHTQLYEASTIMDPPNMRKENAFVQFVFDNTDHNVNTMDGHETFHCLGGIPVYTPRDTVSYEGGTKKCIQMPSAEEISSKEAIPIIPFTSSNTRKLDNITFLDTDSLDIERSTKLLSPSYVAYLLAKTNEITNIPSWKAFMEVLSRDQTYSMSHIECLPFVNGQPSDQTTLHSALLYAVQKSNECNQETIFVTFDLPFIVEQSENPDFKRIVVRLGGFHLLLSYLGAIGHIMEGSGLEDLWATVYAGESVKKLMTGHAFSRSVRAHILTFTAIGVIICERIEGLSYKTKDFIQTITTKWAENAFTIDNCNADGALQQATSEFILQLEKFEKMGATSKLWAQYMKMVIIALQFIESERLGNWVMYLQAMEKMLPILHAAGHFGYAKGLQIFLQDMAKLKATMNYDEYTNFTEKGYFTIRRSNKPFCGIWSDMTIEQTLNRFFGTDLKHGRGVTPSVVARYLLGMPSAFQVMECLEEYTGLSTVNSEQHVDGAECRIKKDTRDLKKFTFWLRNHDPFKVRHGLTSLSTGIIGGDNINCHMALEKGREGMKLMLQKTMNNVKLSAARSKIKNFRSAIKGINVSDDSQEVDTNLLFQRICMFFHGNEQETRNALSYELSPFPPSLFDEEGYMRKSSKSELFKLFKAYPESDLQPKDFYNVIDGGWLLHKVVWPHGKTYSEVFEIYFKFIKNKFGSASQVVFDGYSIESMNSTKSYERHRRKERNVAPDVEISENALVTMTQKKFLSNIANKYRFVELLSHYLRNKGTETTIAKDDADAEIVRKALQLDEQVDIPVAVVGSDVDLLILLIGLTPNTANLFFFKIPPGQKHTQIYSTSNNKEFKQFILFAHAFAGCDSTSSIFNQGKKSIIGLLKKNEYLAKSVSIFYEKDKVIDELYVVAENVLKKLYSSSSTSMDNLTIAELRYKVYSSLVTTAKKQSALSLLPPTSSALKMHTGRVYYQVQVWLNNEKINPKDWGWKSSNFMLVPKMLEDGVPVAPDSLLKNVSTSMTNICDSGCLCNKFIL
nr:unnamed protein product [Callosobruchus chinensis]